MDATAVAASSAELSDFVEALDHLTPGGIFGALTLLIIGLIAIRIAMSLMGRVIGRLPPENKALMNFLRQGLRIVLYFILATTVIDQLGLPVTSLVAVISLLGLAVSLSVQSVLANVVSGILILTAHPFEVGDYIETATAAGTVDAIHLTYTHLLTPDNKRVLVPNSELAAQRITNYSGCTHRRVEVTVRVGYEHENRTVIGAMLRAAEKTPEAIREGERRPAAVCTAYEDTAAVFSLRVWVESGKYWDVYFALMNRVREELAADGVLLTYGGRRMIEEKR